MLWQLRPNLQVRFPLAKNRAEDYLNFLAWCVAIGRRESALLREIDEWNQELTQPIELPELQNDPWGRTFSVAIYLAGIHRARYRRAQIESNGSMRHRVARWYFREGRQLIDLQRLPVWQLRSITESFETEQIFFSEIALEKDSENDSDEIKFRNKDLDKCWVDELSLSKVSRNAVAFPLRSSLERALANVLPVEVNLIFHWLQLAKLKCTELPNVADLSVLRQMSSELPQSITDVDRSLPFGVNLFGYANGELGLGEDIRMLALAFEANKVPFCVINIALPDQVSQQDNSIDHWVTDVPIYSVNIFCMTGIEMTRYVLEKGLSILSGFYNIGYWPWELPLWPEHWHHALFNVDEIWGISEFTSRSYRSSNIPVVSIKQPVQLGAISKSNRSDWGLPENTYLFVFSFDMNSKLTRKNPEGVVNAFYKAFSHDNDRVGLVIKCSHLDVTSSGWKKLQKLIDGDSRVFVFSEEYRKEDLLGLYRCCDCFVSLHRSEGFGRSIAEAQLLGKQVVTTGFSGNMDFCAEGLVKLVDYELVELSSSEYFYGDGQVWADPNIDHASQLMCESYEERNSFRPVYDLSRFDVKHCGQCFHLRLKEIASSKKYLNREFVNEY